MPRRRTFIVLGLTGLAILVVGLLAIVLMRVPKPQVAFVDGQSAPDFTLQDQNGQPFHLAAARGSRVVLVFYRGYW
jgi:cytochrome oxidase Cu insertion factor (SCO1/SenC/PrrC family)